MSRLGGLRPRLALLVTGLVAVSLAIAFAVVYQSTSSQLSDRTDRDLRADMDQLRAAVISPDAGDNDVDKVLERADEYVRGEPFRATARLLFVAAPGYPPVTNQPLLLRPEDESRESGEDESDHEDARHERREAIVAAGRFLTAPPGYSDQEIPEAGDVRLLTERQTAEDGEPLRLGVGAPVEPDQRARDDILDAFLIAGAIALLGALAGALAIASRVVAPLRRMARVAAEVDAGDLGGRMGAVERRDEIGVLARSFDNMLDRLQDAFDRQNAFVADASHELRTPLTVIRGQLEVLGMEQDPPPGEVQRVEQVVRTEVDRMARLVDDLLVLARAGERGFLRREPIDLPVVDGMRRTANRRFELAPVPPLVLDADPDRLAQALRNLLTNAIAHTAAGGLVRVSAAAGSGELRLTVDDDGPGIPPEQRASALDRFHRLDPGRGSDGGAGLGLSIAAAIALAHGGSIEIGDSPQGGARVTIAVPIQNDGGSGGGAGAVG